VTVPPTSGGGLLARLLRAAGLSAGVPVLDLHGYGVKDAIAVTEQFVREASAAGTREVRIIYGKGRGSPEGRGVLREVIPRWLAADGARWVESATPVADVRGEDGAIRVTLRGRM
jgi:DNA-nicking Smr family endonuclease